jgi:hypothetical protein
MDLVGRMEAQMVGQGRVKVLLSGMIGKGWVRRLALWSLRQTSWRVGKVMSMRASPYFLLLSRNAGEFMDTMFSHTEPPRVY